MKLYKQNAVERVHCTLMQHIQALQQTYRQPWAMVLSYAVYGYNMTKHLMTGYSPFSLMFSFHSDIIGIAKTAIADINAIRSQVQVSSKAKRQVPIDHINKRRRKQSIHVNDMVYTTDIHATKLESRVEEQPYKVVKLIGNQLVQIEDVTGYQMVPFRKHIVKLNEVSKVPNQN